MSKKDDELDHKSKSDPAIEGVGLLVGGGLLPPYGKSDTSDEKEEKAEAKAEAEAEEEAEEEADD